MTVKMFMRFAASLFLFAVIAAAGIRADALSVSKTGTATKKQSLYLTASTAYPVSSYATSYLGKGQKVSVYFKEGGYYYIKYKGTSDKRGYVPVSAVSVKGSVPANTYKVWYTRTAGQKSQSVCLCPETKLKTGTVSGSDSVKVIGEDGSWYYIEYSCDTGLKRGYVPKSQIVTGSGSMSISVVETPVSNQSPGNYCISVKVTGGTKGITKVSFPTWTTKNGQDDIKWITGVIAGGSVWSCAVKTPEHHNEKGAYITHVYAYDAGGHSKCLGLSPVTVGSAISYQQTTYAKSGQGRSIVYNTIKPLDVYKKSKTTRKLLLTFELHGFEDSYARDGQVLADIGNALSRYYAANRKYLSNFQLMIVPSANPDGLYDGTTNNGKGRTQISKGIDLNRDFAFYFMKNRADPRNHTLSAPLSAPESKALSNLVAAQKPYAVIDLHGWLNETYGDGGLAGLFKQYMGLPGKGPFTKTQDGFFSAWAAKYSTRTMLAEYPAACANGSRDKYITSTINTLNHIMYNYTVDDIPTVITLGPHVLSWTNKPITVSAAVNKGTLGAAAHTFTANGIYTFRAYDLYGKEITGAAKTVTIGNIDTQAPTQPTIAQSGNTLTITPGTDALSGVRQTVYQIGGAAWATYQKPFKLAPGSYRVSVKTVDNAGNESLVVTQTVKIPAESSSASAKPAK